MAKPIEKVIQWQNLKTYKFFVQFSAFQPEVSNSKLILLRQLPQKVVLNSVKLKHSAIFDGPGIGRANIKVQWGIGGAPFINSATQICEFDLQLAVSPVTGIFKTMPQFRDAQAPVADPVIFNHDYATDIFLQLDLGGGNSINDLNQGAFEIWLTTFRNT